MPGFDSDVRLLRALTSLEGLSVGDAQGSFGNGSAMRVAPLGAYFADDPDRIPDEAARSAEVTHAHPEPLPGLGI